MEDLIHRIIELALEEDGEDVTSHALFLPEDMLMGEIRAKEQGMIAGVTIAELVFRRVDQATVFERRVSDGALVRAGQDIAMVKGTARALLKAERVALNFMQRMSGIATMTAQYVEEIRGSKACLLDTRKTAPGNRLLDKCAVRIGGGMNHRMGLFDMALIKDNHIDRIGSISEAVKRVREKYPSLVIEVEARNLKDVEESVQLGVDRIMLDNFALSDMREAVKMVAGRIPLEASGGITLANIRDVATTGVDFISVGEITHSVRALDISMTVEGMHG
jgi:nicotinate-nucleotide pyrophosphorylase (carboxylating)